MPEKKDEDTAVSSMDGKLGSLNVWFLRYARGQTERHAHCNGSLP